MSSPSPSAPPPVAISPRSSARLLTGYTPGTAAPLIYARALPHPAGAGDAGEVSGYPLPQARVGWGLPARYTGIPKEARAGWEWPAEVYGYPPRRPG
jgi:hypothetical protein